MDAGGASSMGGVCARDMTIGEGSDVPVGGVCAYEVEANTEVDGVCSDSSSDVELHKAH